MSSDNVHDFDECLEEGKYWEERLKYRIETVFMQLSVDRIRYDDSPDKQRNGIDLELDPDEITTVDTKVRDHEYAQYDDIVIETMSVAETGELGWFYTSDADVIGYAWKNQAGTNLLNPGYLIVLSDRLRDWFQDHYDEYPLKEAQNDGWTTEFRPVPIDDFPEGTLVEFPAKLPVERVTDQQTLGGVQ